MYGACLKSKSRTLTMKDFTLTKLATAAAEKHNGKCNVCQGQRVKVCLKSLSRTITMQGFIV